MTTSSDPSKWLEAIRGSLPAEGPGARGLERMARNSRCNRLEVLTLAGVRPAAAAKKIYGESAEEGQSPFAISRGNRFEKHLLDEDAKVLVELYQKEGRLPETVRVADLSRLCPGTKPEVMEQRRHETLRLIREALSGQAGAPQLMIKPRLPFQLLEREYDVEPDFVVVVEGRIMVGEIKSYSDRGGKTDPAKIRGACRQAAVGVVALRAVLDSDRPDELVPAAGDLVLAVPGSNIPTLRPMTLDGEVDSLRRALEAMPARLEQTMATLPLGTTLDQREALEAIPNHYCASCREHCALATVCRRAARAVHDPGILGDRAREQLAPVVSLLRAMELMRGEGDEPRDEAEARLAERLRAAGEHYGEAVNHGW
jgi:hypothetical protein